MEALISALPITAIVYVLAISPFFDFSGAELAAFTIGAVFLIFGIGLFNLGADLAMTPMGSHVGSGLSRQKKLGLLLGVCFVLGMLITIAEPDLTVLANQVPSIPNMVLILTVAVGVGLFLMLSQFRIQKQIPLSYLLVFFYVIIFILAFIIQSILQLIFFALPEFSKLFNIKSAIFIYVLFDANIRCVGSSLCR